MLHPTRLPLLLTLTAAALLFTGCAASSGSSVHATSYQTRLASSSSIAFPLIATSITLSSTRPSYRAGESISLSLVNAGTSTYGQISEPESCATPTAVWLRNKAGATYFVRSGASNACEKSLPIAPGGAAALVTFDSDLVWFDRSDETLRRMPRSLPVGSYSVHALTPIGELITNVEITAR